MNAVTVTFRARTVHSNEDRCSVELAPVDSGVDPVRLEFRRGGLLDAVIEAGNLYTLTVDQTEESNDDETRR